MGERIWVYSPTQEHCLTQVGSLAELTDGGGAAAMKIAGIHPLLGISESGPGAGQCSP